MVYAITLKAAHRTLNKPGLYRLVRLLLRHWASTADADLLFNMVLFIGRYPELVQDCRGK